MDLQVFYFQTQNQWCS